MISYANQRTIFINREVPKATKENKRPYTIIYRDNIDKAMKNISKVSTLKAYLYLVGNVDKYYFALSTQDISEVCGISVQSAKEAINDLIEKGYLVLREKHLYDFYETAHEAIELMPVDEVRKEFKTRSGEILKLTYQELVNLVGETTAEIKWRESK